MYLECCNNSSFNVISFWLLRVENIDRKTTSRNLENRRAIKELRELLSIKSRTRNQEFQVWPEPCHIFDKSKQDICMQSPLVSLINHETRVRLQIRLRQELPQQHTISHIFEHGAIWSTVFESNAIANLMAEFAPNFLGDSGGNGHRCNTSRLRYTNFAIFSVANLMEELRHLCSFTWACLSNDNQNLIVSDRCQNIVPHIVYRQWFSLCFNW